MLKRQAYRFVLKPSVEQAQRMRQFAGACRFVYNEALQRQKDNLEAGKKHISYVAMAKLLPGWCKGTLTPSGKDARWLKEMPSQTLQQSLMNLDRAYTNFFEKRAAFPKFKAKGVRDSFRYPQGFKLDQGNNRAFLPKLGWVRYRNSRKVEGTVKNITVSLSAGKWYASIQTEREVEQPYPAATSAIGVDVGIRRFATYSDGKFLAPVNSFKKHEQRLAKYQRAMSRKQKFSKNWMKTKAKVQKMYARIANVRADYLHKASYDLSKNHAVVCVEDLQIRNMSTSAAGTSDAPGKNVRQKSGLNKAIHDQGWGGWFRMLSYKLEWNGGMLIKVPPQYTSQTCPQCGHVHQDNRKTQARFQCVNPDCAYEENADVVGAINVLRRGLSTLEIQHEGLDTSVPFRCVPESPEKLVNGAVRPSAAGTIPNDCAGAAL